MYQFAVLFIHLELLLCLFSSPTLVHCCSKLDQTWTATVIKCIIHFLINYVNVLQIKRLQTQQVSKGQVCSNTHAPAHADLPEKDRCPYSAPVNRQCVKTFKAAHLTSPPCLSPHPELFIFCP